MPQGVFTDVELSAIKLAANRVAENLKVEEEDDRLVVFRAVFDLAAEIKEFDPGKLVEIAEKRLTHYPGSRFS